MEDKNIPGVELQRGKCRVCINVDDASFCKIKKIKVKTNKSRVCQDFWQDMSKVKVSSKPKAHYTPFHLSTRGEYKKYLKKEEEKQKSEQINSNLEVLKTPDCLSQFRSTAQ